MQNYPVGKEVEKETRDISTWQILDKLSFNEVVKQLKCYELSVYIRLASYFPAEFYIFGLSLSLTPSLCPYFSGPCPACPLGLLDSSFAAAGSPWVIVAVVGPWSHPSSFGLPFIWILVRWVMWELSLVVGSVRGPPIFLWSRMPR